MCASCGHQAVVEFKFCRLWGAKTQVGRLEPADLQAEPNKRTPRAGRLRPSVQDDALALLLVATSFATFDELRRNAKLTPTAIEQEVARVATVLLNDTEEPIARHRQVRVGPLLPTHEDAAEAVKPGVRALDHPAPGAETGLALERRSSPCERMRQVKPNSSASARTSS
jgi:hypothetical protein